MVPLLALVLAQPANAQQRRCFDETGYCVEGPILSYWQNNGGLEVFGYPISELREESIEGWTGPVQWFERDRLEDHGPDGVMAGRLGADILELRGRSWYDYPTVTSAPSACLYFQQTGHSLCPPFRAYWENNGGIERFGYPITEPHEETIDDWTGTVQYFERRRMEHHPENSGTPYDVLLGLLGTAVLDARAGGGGQGDTNTCQQTVLDELQDAYTRVPFADNMGCPTEVVRDRPAAIQNMEHGVMLWVDFGEDDWRIFAISAWGWHESFHDTWEAGMADPNVDPPAGLFAPKRGFGKVWQDNPDVRNNLGWAVEDGERAETVTVQRMQHGMLVWLQSSDMVYALSSDGYVEILSRLP